MEKNYKTKKEEMKNEKTAGNAVVFENPESIGSFAFAVKKGGKHENLIKDFNEALKEMKKDGTYDKIMNKWLGDSEKSSSSKPSADLKLTGDANAKATLCQAAGTAGYSRGFGEKANRLCRLSSSHG